MMFKRHSHEWNETTGRIFFSPLRGGKVNGIGDELLEELLYGVTIVNLGCKSCGDIAQRRLLGKVER